MGSGIDAGHPFDLLLKHWAPVGTLLPLSVRFRIIGLHLKGNLQLGQRLSHKPVAKEGNLHVPMGSYLFSNELEPR